MLRKVPRKQYENQIKISVNQEKNVSNKIKYNEIIDNTKETNTVYILNLMNLYVDFF